MSNKGAENTLLRGFAGSPQHRYLPAVDRQERTFQTDLLPGVRIHALGPSHSPDVIATLNPPKGKFFPAPDQAGETAAVRTDGSGSAGPAARIFPDRYRINPKTYASLHRQLSDYADVAELQRRAEDDLLGAAAALEDAINGTSLVLAVEIGNRCVLLGGDAEWGTWSEILADTQWCDVLRRTIVYKVSHHGSYNGTPKPFVDNLLPKDAISLVSLRRIDRWPSIPRTTLLDALGANERTLVRTDRISSSAAASAMPDGDLAVTVTVPVG